jgi:hypothetical protein
MSFAVVIVCLLAVRMIARRRRKASLLAAVD